MNLPSAAEIGEDSPFDLTPSSWLLDDDAIRRLFGVDGSYLSYEEAADQDGSVLPSFARAVGIESVDAPESWKLWLNAAL
jgi:hypothetical protein